ncbi:hypothetical protein BJ912DRAFT_965526 [Pholiota molesta]|nr:hypothetical protein BJ912DRAFT_965526 [Pholiota molesta]
MYPSAAKRLLIICSLIAADVGQARAVLGNRVRNIKVSSSIESISASAYCTTSITCPSPYTLNTGFSNSPKPMRFEFLFCIRYSILPIDRFSMTISAFMYLRTRQKEASGLGNVRKIPT